MIRKNGTLWTRYSVLNAFYYLFDIYVFAGRVCSHQRWRDRERERRVESTPRPGVGRLSSPWLHRLGIGGTHAQVPAVCFTSLPPSPVGSACLND